MSRSKFALVSLVLLLLLAAGSVLFLRWLVARHLVELLRPAGVLSVVAIIGLGAGLAALSLGRSRLVRCSAAALLVLPVVAVALLLATPVSLRLSRVNVVRWLGFSPAQVSSNGHLLATVGSWPHYYSDRWIQVPLDLIEVKSGRRVNIGLAATGSHTPHLSSVAFDVSGCRAFWLRLEPDSRIVGRILTGRVRDPSRLAEESWPARLFRLDACDGGGQPESTRLTVPSLETRLTVVGAGRYVAAHTENRLWVFDLVTQKVRAEFDLPRDELDYWIVSQSLSVDGTTLTMIREDWGSFLETLELDLESQTQRRISLVDFEGQPKPGFESAEADLLAIEPTMETAVVRREHTRWLQPTGLESDCDFELYDLRDGRRLFTVDEAACGMLRASATYLSGGRVAVADDLYTRSAGVLHLVSRSGEILMTREWPETDDFHVLWETPRGAILVSYRDSETKDQRVELFDPETQETQTVAIGYFPVGRTDTGILVGNEEEILEVDEDLRQRVLLSGI